MSCIARLAPESSPQCVCTLQMGMPHRGRLNLLCNLLHKPAGQLFGELLQAVSEFHIGDVQYHQGQASTLAFPRNVVSACWICLLDSSHDSLIYSYFLHEKTGSLESFKV